MSREGSDITGPPSVSVDGFNVVFVLPETSIAMHPAITSPTVGRRYDIDDLRDKGVGGATTEKGRAPGRSEEHTSELQSQSNLVCRLLLEKKKKNRRATSNMWTSTKHDIKLSLVNCYRTIPNACQPAVLPTTPKRSCHMHPPLPVTRLLES